MRKESMSREVLRHPEFEGCVTLARKRDHFICTFCPCLSLSNTFLSVHCLPSLRSTFFRLVALCGAPTNTFAFPALVLAHTVNIESEGAYTPEALFLESIKVMREKISVLKRAVEAFSNSSGDGDIQMEDA